MSEENQVALTDEMIMMLDDLKSKADVVYEKSEKSSNVHLSIGELSVPIRVDDLPLLFMGARLLPNIVNYLVNILPQFIYPYIVAYLQDLSQMRDDPVTINELYDYLKSEK